MNRTLTSVLLAMLVIARAAVADPGDPRKGVHLEIKGRSIPENSVERSTPADETATPIDSVILIGDSAEETADDFDAAMISATPEVGPVGVALIAHELAHVVQQSGGGSAALIAHELAHVVQQRGGGGALLVVDRHTGAEVWNQAFDAAGRFRLDFKGGNGAVPPAVANVLTNVQKSKHDAAMAAIQNTR